MRLPSRCMSGSPQICDEANRDRSIKVLMLQGAGDKAFASGTDINQFRAFTTPQHALEYEARIDRVLTQLEQCRVPTIAAIAGACTGGGAGIAACCDLRIGTKTTRIGFPIARTLGNCLSMSSISRLTALVGPARVKDLIFTARLVGAEEAAHLGLLNEVVEDLPALQKRADELATLIAGHAPLTLNATKQALVRLHAAAVARGRRGPDPHVLHEPRFSRRARRLPQQAAAALDRGVRFVFSPACGEKAPSRPFSLDHPIGAAGQRERHVEAKRFCSFQIDVELNFGRLLNRQNRRACRA